MIYEVILDTGETANKCTIAPLMDRPDFHILHAKNHSCFGPLSSSVLLHHEGICLTSFKSDSKVQGIASVDCIWNRLDGLLNRILAPLPTLVRIPTGFETAYPRRSKLDHDPDGGLATIEAIFVASALLGHWDPSLLSKYFFGRQFIEINKTRFLNLGVHQAAGTPIEPYVIPVRNSQQRKRNRGQLN